MALDLTLHTLTCRKALILLFIFVKYVHGDSDSVRFSIDENVRLNTKVGNLKARLKEQHLYGDGIDLTRATFKKLKENGPKDRLFRIEGSTGIIYTNAMIDREKQCEQKPKCEVNFLVRYTSSDQKSGLTKVFISINDVNDNAPEFRRQKIVIQVPEAVPGYIPNQPIPLPKAIEKDTPSNGVKRYELQTKGDSDTFFKLTGASDRENLQPRLKLMKGIDRETHSSFSFKLIAVDAGNLKGEMKIVVEVNDLNDNPPQWEKREMTVHIKECASRNSLLTKLQASDKDAGKNGHIDYRISRFADSFISRMFYIQDQSLYLAYGLDYEKEQVIRIPVEAVDGGGLSALAHVNVIVTDCNDNKPAISIIKEDNGPTLLENFQKPQRLVTVVARDKDKSNNGQVTCSLDSSLDSKLVMTETFNNPKTYEIKNNLAHHFDRETESRVNVRIICTDKGEPRNTAVQEFYVTILDQNDNSPEFEENPFKFRVAENRPQNTLVGTIRATDRDIGQNARLSYSISEAGSKAFMINKNGELRTKMEFDRERNESFTFVVTAVDEGKPRRTSSSTVFVEVMDVNDCAPKFEKTIYVFNVLESYQQQINHDKLGVLNATDEDSKENGTVTYRLLKGSGVTDDVTNKILLTRDGQLNLNGVIDREKQDNFDFYVVASDKGNPPMTATVMVKVNILDKNDNKPTFTNPISSGTITNISLPMPVGSTITTISAVDPDSGENGSVTYHIEAGTRNDYFNLDDKTGTLVLQKAIEKNFKGSWRLMLKATDGGGLSSKTILIIKLVNGRSSKGHTPYGERGIPVEDNSKMTLLYTLAAVVFAVFVILFVILVLFYLRCCDCKKGPRKEGRDAESHHYDAVNMPVQENQYQERQGKETLPLDASLLPRDTGCKKIPDEYNNEENGYTNLHTGQRVRTTSYGYIPVNMNEEGIYGTRTMRRVQNPRPADSEHVAVTPGSYEAFNLVGGGDCGPRDGRETLKRHGQNVGVDNSGTGQLLSNHSYTRLESPSKTVNRNDKGSIEPSPFTSLKSPYITTSFV